MVRTLRTIRSLASVSSVSGSIGFLIGPIDQGIAMGRTNERISRNQETYTASATTSWLESLERSLAQMKEYQVC